MFHH
jgi:hypothetical protein